MLNPKQHKSKSAEADPNFTCLICIEPVGATNRFVGDGGCRHDFCSECISKYIEANLVEFYTSDIGCPALGCSSSLDPLSCRSILPSHVFEKWCDLLCNETVLRCYENMYVYCPYRDCSALIVNECKDNANKCYCPNCKRALCFKCESQWHAGYRCSENGEYRDENDILVSKLIEKKKWTRCPLCRHSVERTDGCLLIHCRCGLTFCHACGKADTGIRNCCKKRILERVIFCFGLILGISIVGGLILGARLSYSSN